MRFEKEDETMMTPRENYLAFLNQEPVDWIPTFAVDFTITGSFRETWENGPIEGGYDAFGNNWLTEGQAVGQPALDSNVIPLDDVCDWEEKVVFPDLDAIDWPKFAEQELAPCNREEKVIEYHTWNSVFLRLTHLLSFEDALCAFYEEPVATKALCDAIADYKVALLERVAKWIKPDSYVHYDDVATEKSLFMAPEIYREFIKPGHTKMNDAARALGMIPVIHVCGYCTDIIPDLIDEGSKSWQSAQPSNDINAIIEQYGDRISVMGGYDTQGLPGREDASDETIATEVHRCLNEYGKYGHSYGFSGFRLGNMRDPRIIGGAAQYAQELAAKN